MAIPDYESIMLPLLQKLSDGRTYGKQEITSAMASHFKLTDEELAELVKSGTPLFGGRVHWAIQYMLNANLVERPARAQVRITQRGLDLLASNPVDVDSKTLRQYPEFIAWQGKSKEKTRAEESENDHTATQSAQLTPDEQIDRGYTQIRNTLAEDLLEKVKASTPRFFEQLVVELLVRMGYGGSINRGEVVGRSGDGGIDGIIKEDKLGLDVIYIQAKKWEGSVGQSTIRDFSGSLDPHGAKKGVIITTGTFTKEARSYVTNLGEKKIVLIDGFELAQLMIDHDIGVSTATTYTIKRLDSDYFEE